MQATVRTRYTAHIHLAPVLSRGWSLLRMGPVASAENTLTLPPTIEGRTAMVKKTIPSPPIHWVRERQNSSPRGRASTSLMMVAPVVVKPDIVSKKASVKEKLSIEEWAMSVKEKLGTMKGIMPNRENNIHDIVTTK